MLKPDERIIRALGSLENDNFFAEVVNWIEKSLLTQSIANNKLTGEATIKGQGRCLELEELLKHIRDVRKYDQNAKEAKAKGG